MIAFDCEMTCTDFYHGALPYSMQFCDGETKQSTIYEWNVNPLNRQVLIDPNELEIAAEHLTKDDIVGHHVKIDLRAFDTACLAVRPDLHNAYEWDWPNIHDSLVMSHCWKNLWMHGLKHLRNILFFVDDSKQKRLLNAVNKARRICRSQSFYNYTIEKIKKGEDYGSENYRKSLSRNRYLNNALYDNHYNNAVYDLNKFLQNAIKNKKLRNSPWRIAGPQDRHWPGIKDSPKVSKKGLIEENEPEGWAVYDMWLPKAIATFAPKFLPEDSDDWYTLSKDYGIEDVETTLPLFDYLKEELQKDDLWDKYLERQELIPITYNMETSGVSLLPEKLESEIKRYQHISISEQDKATSIAYNILANSETEKILPLPKKQGKKKAIVPTKSKTRRLAQQEEFNISSDHQIRSLLFDTLKVPVITRTAPTNSFPKGQPSVNADVLSTFADPNYGDIPDEAREFCKSLLTGKKYGKALDALISYKQWASNHIIHSSINICGTRFTRQSTNDPNLQNVGTGSETIDNIKDFMLRLVFGPRPGLEWLSIDFQSIEALIWAFSVKNMEIMACVDRGISPFKPLMEAVWGFFDKDDPRYKPIKNGFYSILYGAKKSHSDATFGKVGAVDAIIKRIPEVRSFTQKLHKEVLRKGYIETIAGYRLYIPKDEPHKAVSGFVQGHAGWVIGQAMKMCIQKLREYYHCNTDRLYQSTSYVKPILQIHDELIFEGPIGFHRTLGKMLAETMSSAGTQYDIPTPVNMTLITDNWAEGIAL